MTFSYQLHIRMHRSITPVILALDEAPNLARTLEKLVWARDIVLVDSFSTDTTLEIAARYSSVRVFQRQFDDHASQWNYAISHTSIQSDWILALDADFVLSEKLIDELGSLAPPANVSGYRARFVYCIEGHPLRATVYTPVTVLFRRGRAVYARDGHTQRVKIDGNVVDLSGVIFHDDRKSLSRWVASQDRYMRLEAEKLANANRAWSNLDWAGRIRKLRVVAPFAMLFYCLFVKGLVLDGRAGLFYSFQRAFAELLLSLHLLQHDLSPGSKTTN